MFMQPFDRLHEICYDVKNVIVTERLTEHWDEKMRKKKIIWTMCL